MIAPTPLVPAQPVTALQHAFLAILPTIERHARARFRHVRCPHRREDCEAEAVALAWEWFVRLARRGKDATAFPGTLAVLAARAVRSGRRVCGQEPARDVMSPLARQRHAFAVTTLPEVSTLSGNPFDEALWDNAVTPVPEQAAFRADFPRWRGSHPSRDRDLIDRLMLGGRTKDVADALGLSPGRVSQKRREFRAGWERFCGERPEDARVGSPA